MYANGRGVPEDDAEAVRWYRLAAEQGHAHAQYNLGVKYDNGDGAATGRSSSLFKTELPNLRMESGFSSTLRPHLR